MRWQRPSWPAGIALLVLLALALTTGCEASSPQTRGASTGTSSAPTASSAEPTSARPVEATATATPPSGRSEEPTTAPPVEETDTSESPATGDSGVSIELAGLPVGGGAAKLVGDAWCMVLFWGQQLPPGVELAIDAVAFAEDGAQLRPEGCDEVPACVGTVIVAGGSQGCAVLVEPPAPQQPSLTARLDGTLRCPDQQACDALDATGGSTVLIENPGGGTDVDGNGAGGDSPAASREGTDDLSNPPGTGGESPTTTG